MFQCAEVLRVNAIDPPEIAVPADASAVCKLTVPSPPVVVLPDVASVQLPAVSPVMLPIEASLDAIDPKHTARRFIPPGVAPVTGAAIGDAVPAFVVMPSIGVAANPFAAVNR